MAGDLSVVPHALGRLPDLNLRQLLSFRAVAATGSFHEAADELEYTQSAVSQHVAALEAALDVRLFERGRGRRTVELTEAGRMLLRHVEAIVGRLQSAQADLTTYAAGMSGTLRVGAYQSVGTHVLPAVVGPFAAAWPGVDLQLSETGSDEGLLDLVRSGTLDLSFSVLPLPEGPFDGVELLRDPYVLVVAARSPLASLPSTPSLQLIGEQPLIGFRSCRSTRAAEAYLRQAGADPHFVFRSEDNGTVQAMVGAGIGAALVPLLSVDPTNPATVIVPTDLPPRRIALMWHRDRYRSPAAVAFVELARRVCAEVQRTIAPQLALPPEAAGVADFAALAEVAG